jgi:hypothetical protein
MAVSMGARALQSFERGLPGAQNEKQLRRA